MRATVNAANDDVRDETSHNTKAQKSNNHESVADVLRRRQAGAGLGPGQRVYAPPPPPPLPPSASLPGAFGGLPGAPPIPGASAYMPGTSAHTPGAFGGFPGANTMPGSSAYMPGPSTHIPGAYGYQQQYQYNVGPAAGFYGNHSFYAPQPRDLTVGELGWTLDDLRTRFPNLDRKNMLDEMSWESLSYLTINVLATKDLENIDKAYTIPKTAEDRLDRNKLQVLVSTVYPEQADDLQYVLHATRFTRMPVTPSKKLFQLAREQIGQHMVPILNYNFDHLRMSHRISIPAFLEAHQLCSQKVIFCVYFIGFKIFYFCMKI